MNRAQATEATGPRPRPTSRSSSGRCRVTPGRRQLACAGVQGGRRHAVLRGPRPGRVRHRRRGRHVTSTTSSLTGPRYSAMPTPRWSRPSGGRPARAPPSARRRLREVLLAEEICPRVPGCDEVRLVSSGTEAAMSAVRLARGATGPRTGGAFRRLLPRPQRRPAGGRRERGGHARACPPPPGCRRQRWPRPLSSPTTSSPKSAHDVAAVMVEPVAANMGLVPPGPGFLEGLREACTRAGALLIFDEVITGFPGVARRGFVAVRGRARPVVLRQGGGRGPPLGCLRRQTGGDGRSSPPTAPSTRPGRCRVTRWRRQPDWLSFPCSMTPTTRSWPHSPAGWAPGWHRPARKRAATCQVPVAGPLLGMFFGTAPSTDYDGARASAGTGLYPPVMRGCLAEGVAIAPGPYEVLFPSLAHGDGRAGAHRGRLCQRLPRSAWRPLR